MFCIFQSLQRTRTHLVLQLDIKGTSNKDVFLFCFVFKYPPWSFIAEIL